MEIDRRAFFASLGGAAAITAMDSEAKADALEEYMSEQLDNGPAAASATSPDKKFPTVAELDAEIDTRTYRRGVGTLFANGGRNVKKLQPLPANPTLLDFPYGIAPSFRFQGFACITHRVRTQYLSPREFDFEVGQAS